MYISLIQEISNSDPWPREESKRDGGEKNDFQPEEIEWKLIESKSTI